MGGRSAWRAPYRCLLYRNTIHRGTIQCDGTTQGWWNAHRIGTRREQCLTGAGQQILARLSTCIATSSAARTPWWPSGLPRRTHRRPRRWVWHRSASATDDTRERRETAFGTRGLRRLGRRSTSGTQCSPASPVVRRARSGSTAARHTSASRAAMSDGSCDAIDGLPIDENMRELWSRIVGSAGPRTGGGSAVSGARSTGWGCVARQPPSCLAKLASGSGAVGRLCGVRLARVRQTAPILVRLPTYLAWPPPHEGDAAGVADSPHRRCRSRRCRVSATWWVKLAGRLGVTGPPVEACWEQPGRASPDAHHPAPHCLHRPDEGNVHIDPFPKNSSPGSTAWPRSWRT